MVDILSYGRYEYFMVDLSSHMVDSFVKNLPYDKETYNMTKKTTIKDVCLPYNKTSTI